MNTDKNNETEVSNTEETLDLKVENAFGGNGFVRRLLNVIPVDIEALLKELDEEM